MFSLCLKFSTVNPDNTSEDMNGPEWKFGIKQDTYSQLIYIIVYLFDVINVNRWSCTMKC